MNAMRGFFGGPTRGLLGRLILSYTAVVAVTLLVAVVALSVLLPTFQAREAEERLSDLARPTAFAVIELLRRGASPDEVRLALAEQSMVNDLRLLTLSRTGAVLSDTATAEPLTGQLFRLTGGLAALRPNIPLRGRFSDISGVPHRYVALPVGAGPNRPRGEAAVLLLAQPEREWSVLQSELLPRLVLASAIALAVAALLGTLMARSIYRPVARLTSASEAMARGIYNQRVTVEGPAELANLAAAFNRMADEVGASRQTMREFVANVSHELRTPLTSIRGFVEAMRDGTVTDEAGRRRSLEVIDSELRRLQRLVAGLLDLSRIESGQADMRHEAVDLTAVLHQCAEIFGPRADEAGIRLRVETPEASPAVLGDTDRLEQLVNNLLDNALRYTPAGGRVTLALAAQERSVQITVSDTGTGIDPHALPHLFGRFYTADPARAGSGAGLGLAIASEIAHAHGGSITVASAPGQGSTFTVTLPASPVTSTRRAPTASPGVVASR